MNFRWLKDLTLYSSCICYFNFFLWFKIELALGGPGTKICFPCPWKSPISLWHLYIYSHLGPSKPTILKFKNFVNNEKTLLNSAQALGMNTVLRTIYSWVHFTAAFIFEFYSPLQCDYWLNYAILSKANFHCSPVGKKT